MLQFLSFKLRLSLSSWVSFFPFFFFFWKKIWWKRICFWKPESLIPGSYFGLFHSTTLNLWITTVWSEFSRLFRWLRSLYVLALKKAINDRNIFFFHSLQRHHKRIAVIALSVNVLMLLHNLTHTHICEYTHAKANQYCVIHRDTYEDACAKTFVHACVSESQCIQNFICAYVF